MNGNSAVKSPRRRGDKKRATHFKFNKILIWPQFNDEALTWFNAYPLTKDTQWKNLVDLIKKQMKVSFTQNQAVENQQDKSLVCETNKRYQNIFSPIFKNYLLVEFRFGVKSWFQQLKQCKSKRSFSLLSRQNHILVPHLENMCADKYKVKDKC